MKRIFRLRATSVNRHPTHDVAILKFSQRIAWTSKVAPICWSPTSSTLPPPSKALLASWAPTTFGSPAIPHWADLPLGTCSDGSSLCVGVGSNLEQATLVSRPCFTHFSIIGNPDGRYFSASSEINLLISNKDYSWSISLKAGPHWSLANLLQIWLASSPPEAKRWANDSDGRFWRPFHDFCTKVFIFYHVFSQVVLVNHLTLWIQAVTQVKDWKGGGNAAQRWICIPFVCLHLSMFNFQCISPNDHLDSKYSSSYWLKREEICPNQLWIWVPLFVCCFVCFWI